jgi:hypothetical protein
MLSPVYPCRKRRVILPVRLGFFGLAALLIQGCNERDWLTFPESNGQGPQSTISDPSTDTTVTAGPFALVGGRVTDADGIDTVYFEVTGGGASFQPFVAGGDDTVTFSLPLATAGLGGITMTIMVFGTDIGGARGDTAVRLVTVQ